MQHLKTCQTFGIGLLVLVVMQPVQAAPKPSSAAKPATAKKMAMCEKFFAAALYNGFLEMNCGFNGQVKDRLSDMMDKAQCLTVLPKPRRDKLADEVLADTGMRLKAYGVSQFCEGNIREYTDLMDILPNNGDTNDNSEEDADTSDSNDQI